MDSGATLTAGEVSWTLAPTSAMNKVLVYVGVVWLLIGLPLLALGAGQLREDRHFATAGRQTVGLVVSKASSTWFVPM